MNLTICTSCWNYSQYIEDWWDGIMSQTKKPDAISFFNNGSTDDTKKIIMGLAPEAERKGIRFIYSESDEKLHFGVARNRAIEQAETEWVCHFDVDDKMLPVFCEDAHANSGGCDVVAVGYQAFGGSTRVKIYPKNRTPKQVLESKAPCSPVAPFKKSLWEKTPYHEELKSSWDTALWIGFAHLGAKFGATRRPGYLYRVHSDSIFMSKGQVESLRIGLDLSALRRKAVPLVSFLVPNRPCDGYRKKNWETVKKNLSKNNLWEILDDDCEGGWNKAKILNELSRKAKGIVLIPHDNDVIVDPFSLYKCVEKVLHGKAWAIPHQRVVRQPGPKGEKVRAPYVGVEGGGVFVIRKDAWVTVGGMDERFSGWGGEDLAFGIVCRAMYGPPHRESSDLVHLWHPPQETKSGSWGNNVGVGMRYWGSKTRMLDLLKLATENRNRNFPHVKIQGQTYFCKDMNHLSSMEKKYGTIPKFLYVGNSPTGLKTGVIRTCIPQSIMRKFPCVTAISESEFNNKIEKSSK